MGIGLPDSCQFKTELVRDRTEHLCAVAAEVLVAMAEYCEDNALPFVITDSVSTADEDKLLKRVSDEHRQGRAFDVSIRGWTDSAAVVFTAYFETRFLKYAAIGKTSGMPRLIFRHDNGHGDHIHVQVARAFGLSDPLTQG